MILGLLFGFLLGVIAGWRACSRVKSRAYRAFLRRWDRPERPLLTRMN